MNHDDAMRMTATATRAIRLTVATALIALAAVLFTAPAPARGAVSGGGFEDVPPSHLFHEHITWLASEGITSGVGDGSRFAPSQPISRGQMAVFLYKIAGSPEWEAPAASPFSDVPTSHTFYRHITWLASEGVTSGVGDGTRFAPDAAVSRAQMAAFLYKLAGSPDVTISTAAVFPDVPVGHTFFTHVAWLSSEGITNGYSNGDFGPSDSVTRGQMAKFLFTYFHDVMPWATAAATPVINEWRMQLCMVEVTLHNVRPEWIGATATVGFFQGEDPDVHTVGIAIADESWRGESPGTLGPLTAVNATVELDRGAGYRPIRVVIDTSECIQPTATISASTTMIALGCAIDVTVTNADPAWDYASIQVIAPDDGDSRTFIRSEPPWDGTWTYSSQGGFRTDRQIVGAAVWFRTYPDIDVTIPATVGRDTCPGSS